MLSKALLALYYCFLHPEAAALNISTPTGHKGKEMVFKKQQERFSKLSSFLLPPGRGIRSIRSLWFSNRIVLRSELRQPDALLRYDSSYLWVKEGRDQLCLFCCPFFSQWKQSIRRGEVSICTETSHWSKITVFPAILAHMEILPLSRNLSCFD